MKLYYKDFQTPLGEMRAIVNDNAVVLLSFKDSNDFQSAQHKIRQQHSLVRISHHPIISRLMSELRAYFYGECSTFRTSVQYVIGTPFQQSVWDALQQIKLGETVHYASIAERIGKPKSVRAVATAIGLNPLSIIIPCHRVIRKDGGLGGFNSGLMRKKHLLELETHIKKHTRLLIH
ncbi:methylated-DNA--[protein]-cysteine S-methyltransferase [Staphylococcus agnetis]|uniref:methylated-DNA--[protein]-cysteine S-methyltransferase n=1 Tax=Staphylococcus agnetis TaxID=985762 RepID=UPI000D042231|nr:methylated-DNA--[protein]-cysteine S-methyltransferase [Staphylococcus agnetis]